MTEEQRELIRKMQQTGVTQEEAFHFFDSLEAVSIPFMKGRWKGSECITGHIMDGMLSIAPWHGKAFITPEAVHPLVFTDRAGKRYCVDPKKVFRFIENKASMMVLSDFTRKHRDGSFDAHKLDLIFRSFRTGRPKARLRELSFRGKVTAAMIYDELAIIDVFRKIDNNTVLGVMDIKGRYGKKGYFFLLERE